MTGTISWKCRTFCHKYVVLQDRWSWSWQWSFKTSFTVHLALFQSKSNSRQSKIIKVLFNKDWLTPTNDLHRELKILKVADVHKLFTLKLIYQHQTHKLPVTYKDYFKFRSEIHSRATRNNMDLHIPKAKTNYGYNSIKVIGAKLFNQLPEGIKKHKPKKNLNILWKSIYYLNINITVLQTWF